MIFSSLLRRLYLSLSELTWWALLILIAAHLVLCYLVLRLAGEEALVGSVADFVYFYIVTATTVGYGDLSPNSGLGRLLAVFFVLPGGIAIFTAVLGKLLTGVGAIWRNRVRGLGDYSGRSGHIIVLGWQEGSTHHVLRLVNAERAPGEPMSVLVAKDLPENPAPDCTDYVRADRIADVEALTRAGSTGARTIIIRGNNDDETLAAVLIAEDHAPGAHIVAYFNDDRTAQLARDRRPRIEAVGSLAEELVSRSARDPGASEIAARLLSASSSDTAFSVPVPTLARPVPYGTAFTALKRHHNVTLVGLSRNGSTDLNCRDDVLLTGGEALFYISAARLDPAGIDWTRMGGTA